MIVPRLLAVAVALTIAGCAAIGPREAAPPFDLLGRVAVNYDGRVFSSGVRWRHAPQEDEISLVTPLGQTVARIVNGPAGATLTTADQNQYEATSVESLTRRGLGWALPLENLRFWVRGEPVPGSKPGDLRRDSEGRLVLLEQEGWRIAFAYPPAGESKAPRRLDLSSGAQRIRLVIDDWRSTGAAR